MAKAKMTVCKACGQEIAASAKVCPHCGAKNKKPIFKKWWFWAIVVILLIAVVSNGSGKNSASSSEPAETAAATQKTESGTEAAAQSTETAAETGTQETAALYPTAADPQNMKLGECGKEDSFYIGLSGVRALDHVQTAIESYRVELEDGQACVYALVEVYNDSDKIRSYSASDISIYADSVQATEPDTIYRLAVDGFKEFSSYPLDPGTKALIVVGGVVEKGWSELTVFAGDLAWKVTPEELTDDACQYTTVFTETETHEPTEPGAVICSEGCEVVFDGFRVRSDSNALTGETPYAVFEFTVSNTTDRELDYSRVGYKMRAYCGGTLLDSASYTLSDTIDGYANVFSVDTIKPGMSAKVYVAFETTEQTGSFACSYDTGYLSYETLGCVYAEN